MKKIFLNLVLATFVLGAIATPSYAEKAPSSKVVQVNKIVDNVVQKAAASKPTVKKVLPHTCTQGTLPEAEDSGTIGIFRKRPPGPGA